MLKERKGNLYKKSDNPKDKFSIHRFDHISPPTPYTPYPQVFKLELAQPFYPQVLIELVQEQVCVQQVQEEVEETRSCQRSPPS